MKKLIIALSALLLSACSATMVSYGGNHPGAGCPPVVSVKTFGSSVIIADASECKNKDVEK